MFNKDFYPTPDNVIAVMLDGLDVFEKTVLEPSAGKGNIIDYLHTMGATVCACENHPDLAGIASSKADKFLGFNFLEVASEQVSHVDFIIMNPPFSSDEKHILHAWEIAPGGCVIKSLCNWETVDNTHTMNRKRLLAVIKEHGTAENIGTTFMESERSTNVEIGLITLFKPKSGGEDEFEGYFDLSEELTSAGVQGLVTHNEITEIVNRYVGAVRMFDDVQDISGRLNDLTSPFSHHNPIRFGAYKTANHNQYTTITRDDYKKELQKAAWKSVFAKMKMDKYVTKAVHEKLNKFVETQTNVPFKLSNIFKMIDMIYQTYAENMNNAILEIFERLTCHTHDNRYHVEGWKTNSQYLIGKKFILPFMVSGDWGKMTLIYDNYGKGYLVDDLTKAMCFLTGKRFDHIGNIWKRFHPHYTDEEKDLISKGVNQPPLPEEPIEFNTWYDWGFFEFKGFKKRTAHFKFKREEDWAVLNQRIAKLKGWGLPETIRS